MLAKLCRLAHQRDGVGAAQLARRRLRDGARTQHHDVARSHVELGDHLMGHTGADRTVLLLIGVAPTPFFVVAFATVENLDVRLTVNTVSLSMLLSLPLALGVILLTT